MALAFRLHKTPDEIKWGMTVSDFLLCLAYLERERTEVTVEHHYLAQIAQEVARVLVEGKDKDKVTREMFLLEHKEKKEEETTVSPVPDYEGAMRRMEASKQAWGAALGAKPDKKELQKRGVKF